MSLPKAVKENVFLQKCQNKRKNVSKHLTGYIKSARNSRTVTGIIRLEKFRTENYFHHQRRPKILFQLTTKTN
jgi:pyridoxal/pyridoxine/pyridoxamine kinase